MEKKKKPPPKLFYLGHSRIDADFDKDYYCLVE